MPHEHFSLEEYHLAQALDYLFLMDEDSVSHIVNSGYDHPNSRHPLIVEHNGFPEVDNVSASAPTL